MVPVELSLSNFLSYGEEAQTLDFTRFHVACLSGKNGQGKSALLDAITWAVWGEARKSSGVQKPDDQLLRIGSRRMRVEFVFDVEGDRYRVIRSFSRSATGKTSKAELEVQLLEEGNEAGIPLTRPSMRETQDILNERLGLDYDTFVNSAFLLQGRSDEFTKKKPNERKNILGKILNLGKFDRLAELARRRQRALEMERERLDREVEIFQETIQQEGEWRDERDRIQEELAKKEKELGSVQQIEAQHLEQVANREMLLKERDSIESDLEQLGQQFQDRSLEHDELERRLVNAGQLIESEPEIQDAYDLYTAHLHEREELDTKREIYRGVEKRIDACRAEILAKRNELEKKIHQLEAEIRHLQKAVSEIDHEMASREAIQNKLLRAKEARDRLKELDRKNEHADRVKKKIISLERRIAGEREMLNGKLNALEEQINRLPSSDAAGTNLEDELRAVRSQQERMRAVQEELERIMREGQEAGESISQHQGALSRVRQDKEKVMDQIERLSDRSTLNCPTCGMSLSEEHRKEVVSNLEGERSTLIEQESAHEAAIETLTESRDALRSTYKALTGRSEELAPAMAREAQLVQKIEEFKRVAEQVRHLVQEKENLKGKIDSGSYAEEQKAILHQQQEQLKDLFVEEEELDRCRFEAAQIDRFEEKMRALTFAEGKKENVQAQLVRYQKELLDLRKQLDSGHPFEQLMATKERLEQQLQKSGFDPDRFEEVRSVLKKYSDAPDKMKDLLHARQNVEDWQKQRNKVVQIQADLNKRRETLEKKQKHIADHLAEFAGLEERLEEIRARRESLENEFREAQQYKGEVAARLSQIADTKEKMKATKQSRKSCEYELNLYKKLKTAFGRNGIQTLIIEQALPEIEERASEILYRLSEGKMQVHLETLKDKKSGGGTRETLEIVITDEHGLPRPYETYSGGEAFRVNFSLRIALSQLLAERNGVKIRTLGIDEGFGTQDEEGIQYLVEAIQGIRDDFDKILVITHLDRLKETFPVRIEVHKDPVLGSQISMLGS